MNNEIFILMDDSGKLNKNETSCIYGGLFFYSSNEYMNFINKYKSVVKELKCHYCRQTIPNCNHTCVELKGTTKMKNTDKRRLFNLIKKQNNYGVFINNNEIYPYIMKDKGARGRYCDYAQKRIVKEIVLYAIKNNKINPNKPLKLYIKSDECKTKSNGYYNLRDSIYEELANGVSNFDYSKIHKPIINNKVEVSYNTYNSKHHFGIQSADMMSHYLHNEYEAFIKREKNIEPTTNFIEVKLFLPEKKRTKGSLVPN